jgi:hypothetical protein
VTRRLTAAVARSLNTEVDALRLDIDERNRASHETSAAVDAQGTALGYAQPFALVRIVRPGVSVETGHPSPEAAMDAALKEYELTDAGWSTATNETSQWRQPEPGVLELELEPLLRARGTLYVLERTLMFGDLAWDADATFQEILHRDWALIVDAVMASQRIVLQRIRGQIRYWLTANRDPRVYCDERELGWVNSLDDAGALCNELLNGESTVRALKTPRFAGGELRGDHR